MEHKNYYNFIGKIALEFRLSLNNICKLSGKEDTEENRMNIYNILVQASDKNDGLIKKYNYLFFYEALNEPQNISKISFEKAVNFVKRYKQAKKEANTGKIRELFRELNKTELDFNITKDKIGRENLSDEDIEIISRYRIKNMVPRMSFCEAFGIHRTSLEEREKKIKDPVLIKKLNILGELLAYNGRKKR